MGIVYQMTFFLGLGLIALVITIFVLAASQVGKATEAAAREQKEMLSKQKKAKEEHITKLVRKLDKAEKAGHLDGKEFTDELDRRKKEIGQPTTGEEIERAKEGRRTQNIRDTRCNADYFALIREGKFEEAEDILQEQEATISVSS